MIGLLDSPTNGEIFIDETNTTTLNDDQISSFRNKKLGFIFQFSNLLSDLSVLENKAAAALRVVTESRRELSGQSMLQQHWCFPGYPILEMSSVLPTGYAECLLIFLLPTQWLSVV